MNRGLRRVFGSVLPASVAMVNLVFVGLAFEMDVTDSVRTVHYACKVSRRELDEGFLGCS